MWDKLNIFGFGWGKKKSTPQPVQKEISINITNGDRKETIQRSPSGIRMASSSTTKHRLDDDDSSEGSTSINFGFKVGPSPKRSSSFSFTREPLDMATWSNVTSPGFTSRLIQQASGHSPLKEFNDSISHSPFRKSPYKDLGLGELPYVNFSRKPRVSSPCSLTLPSRSMRPGVTSSIYNRDRRKNARQGQVFVRIAPIDPTAKASLAINKKSVSPSMNLGNNPYPGGPRDGLGGIPQHQHELAMRFNRMWPVPGSPVPGPGRPLSPTSPSNIIEALASGRKRGREQESYYPGPHNATPPSAPPSKISIGIGDTPVRSHQMQKRVKFIGTPDGHDRPMMAPYSGIGGGDHEPLSSESILEQMNQTEKRFLPDSTSTPYSLHKKGIRMSEEAGPSVVSSSSGLRKRRSQNNVINPGDEEAKGEKFGRYCCPCNECYAEATGNTSLNRSDLSRNSSPNKVDPNDSSFACGSSSKLKKLCDKGVGPDVSKAEYFRELFRKADKKRKPESDLVEEEMTRVSNSVVTKEMYDKDKRKRVERYYKMLKLKPPNGSIFDSGEPDPVPEKKELSGVTGTTRSLFEGVAPAISKDEGNVSGFNFGSPSAPVSSSSFAFGKQSSPVAHTITTNACPTITSASVTGTVFGSSGTSSTSTSAVTQTFGTSKPAPVLSSLTSATSPDAGFKFGNQTKEPAKTAPSVSFGFGSNPITSPQKSGNLALNETLQSTVVTDNQPDAQKEAPTTKETGGFSFSGSTAVIFGTPSASTLPAGGSSFSFGSIQSPPRPAPDQVDNGKATSPKPESGVVTTQASLPTFEGFGSKVDNAKPTLQEPSAGGFSFGQPNLAATTTSSTQNTSNLFQLSQQPSAAAPSFSLGQPDKMKEADNNTDTKESAVSEKSTTETSTDSSKAAIGGFSFGSANAATGGFSFGKSPPLLTPISTAASSSTAPATTAASAPLSIFGGLGNTTQPGSGTGDSTFSLKPATTTASILSNPSFGVTPSSGGSIFGGQTGAAPAVPTFGSGLATSAPAAQVSSPPALNFGAKSGSTFGSGGGITFGGGINPLTTAKPKETQPSTTTTSGGFNFGGGGASSTSFGGFGSSATTSPPQAAPTFGSGAGTFGQPSFPNVPNPLANKSSASSTFGALSSNSSINPPATTAPPTFGSFQGAAAPPVFGGGGGSTSNSGFSFGQNTMSPPQQPQQQSVPSGFAFGGGAPAPAPAQQANSGFSFGQANPTVAPAQSSPGGVFQFGQQQQVNSGSAPFQFGQAAQNVAGGFNFGDASQAAAGQPMFSVGTSSTAPRRRDVRRRHR